MDTSGGWRRWCFAAMAVGLVLGASCSRLGPPAERKTAHKAVATRRAAPREEAEKTVHGADAAAKPSADSSAASPPDASEETPFSASEERGRRLYARHCAACHGAEGDGAGLAARFLFPKPRNIQAGKFRLISTDNNAPSRDDLLAVLDRGMPGSSMPPWRHLPSADREALVDEVMRLRKLGAAAVYANILREQEELTDEELATEEVQEQIRDYVERFTTPGGSTVVPEIKAPTEAGAANALVTYGRFGCLQCHGKEGKGDGVQKMVDDEGYPTRPRDFTAGLFKGGADPASLYRRIAYGMPGTPMPSAPQMTPDQIVEMVHYIRSLSTEEARQAAVLNRETIVVKRVAELPAADQANFGADGDVWTTAPIVNLRAAPLWWRDGADPDLQVQAAHDGKSIAVRLSWRDDTPDRAAMQSETFRDAAALELYSGDDEPFIGMGDPSAPVDVWFWDAARQRPAKIEEQYPQIAVDMYPFSEVKVETAEYERPGAALENQPPISLPAVAAGNPIVPGSDPTGASDLTGGGPGSVTFRLPKNRLVAAKGEWSDGRWTVTMVRPLPTPAPGEGLTLSPGEQASIAFALWDGSWQERDGKKQFTIWQDLVLEK